MSNLRTVLRRYRAFTLVELLIVIVVLAVLAAIVIPKFTNSSARSKESSLRANLKLARNAVDLFKSDTGSFPAALADLAATTAPTGGKNAAGVATTINASDFKGPYIAAVPNDPVAGAALTYSVTSGTVGQVSATATGKDSSGLIDFNTY